MFQQLYSACHHANTPFLSHACFSCYAPNSLSNLERFHCILHHRLCCETSVLLPCHRSFCTALAQVFISCPLWLINDTGLPLVFRQDQSSHEFVNQFSEHERASNRQPLLFSYSDVNQSDVCAARLGRETHSKGTPRWSSSFAMVRGTSFIRLFWKCDGGRPER